MRTARTRGLTALLAAATLAGLAPMAPARALEEQSGEAKAIEACERRLCTLLQQKDARGEDIKCALTKTWARSTIKEADQASLQWGYGDARCTVQINISRAEIVAALLSQGDKYKFRPAEHTANCVVEEGRAPRQVVVKLAPKIDFKDGKAEKVWVNLKSVDGPSSVSGTLWAAAALNDKIGLFHRQAVKQVNRFIYQRCPSKHPLPAAPVAKKAG